MHIIHYHVEGLDCAEEMAILRREVGGLPGVLNLEFDAINARMSVEFDPAALDSERIVEAVSATGMTALPWEQRLRPRPTSSWERHGRLIMTTVSGALILAGFIVHWLRHDSFIHAMAGGGEDHVFPLPVWVLYLAAAAAGAWHVAPRAWQALCRWRPDMNLLMVAAVIGAVAINEWLEAATVSFLFAVSLLLEHWSVERARRAIGALMNLAPPTAREAATGQERPVEAISPGTRILVRPGERIPLDGTVRQGESAVNQAPVTGESMPVPKMTGDDVFAGTINEHGVLEIETTKAAADTTLARIIRMVESAQARRAPTQQWVDRFAEVYTPAMMLLALAVALLPPLVTGAAWAEWIYRGLVVLVIACPCALVIATPVGIVSALTAAARHGVLIKGGAYLEAAGKLRALAMDKTGTLTEGRPEVLSVIPWQGHSETELLERAASLETHSEHPLARAVLRKARAAGLNPPPAENTRMLPGKGVEGFWQGRLFWLGSHRFMHEKNQEDLAGHAQAQDLEKAGRTVVAIGNDSHVCGLLSIADRLRPGVRDVLVSLRALGVTPVVMLTGDNEGTARAIAEEAGVDEFHSELLPEDKVAAIGRLVRQHRHVAMLGDGVNDAPAMAAATFGIAMGAMGTDAALETADVALMTDDLSRLPWLIRHSRSALAIIKQNVMFALGLKLLFIILTLAGLASLWLAILADTGATLLVVANSLRLLRTEPPESSKAADLV
ncbi:MAG: heavy metal translocating P-type ATPase [Lentisphaeria bacterium]|nr:heavy metal translocating P-type ATPase [Lentisphaeria bacterium]